MGKISWRISSDFLVFWYRCKLLNFNIHSDQKLADSKYSERIVYHLFRLSCWLFISIFISTITYFSLNGEVRVCDTEKKRYSNLWRQLPLGCPPSKFISKMIKIFSDPSLPSFHGWVWGEGGGSKLAAQARVSPSSPHPLTPTPSCTK